MVKMRRSFLGFAASLSCLMMTFSVHQVVAIGARYELRGQIKINGVSGAVPRFRILCDGKQTISNSEGFYTFPLEEQDSTRYFLLICPSVNQDIEKSNTIRSMQIVKNAPYRFFEFGKHDLTQATLESLAIPVHTIVLLIDPSLVEDVECSSMHVQGTVTAAPLILLKNSIDRKKIEQAATLSILGSLELMPFHEPVKQSTKHNETNPKVSLALAQ
ncbi:MAG: hypothetical protein WC365_05120 [Candidatus Babeliales bacterium]|jgi:hypothetical protein